MKITIRKFEYNDIADKIRWVNDPSNNRYLHYDLPLEIEKTRIWFNNNADNPQRFDAVIEADGNPVGLIGLLSIDTRNKKAEYYILIGEAGYLRKGVAAKATELLLNYAFRELVLERVYLYTETENIPAVRLYERLGFVREGVLRNDILSRGRYVDRYIYAISRQKFMGYVDTPVYKLDEFSGINLYIKREDFIPFSFGGNKARKAKLFFDEIDANQYNCVVSYGSSSSNHCRVVANMAAARQLPCYIISPIETHESTFNEDLVKKFGAEIILCPLDQVKETIDDKVLNLRKEGLKPYFIAGGGHGNIGTQAYVECYDEIRRFERNNHIFFDYIFLASGTGTTQAGLICGQLTHSEDRNIIGISIARENPRGRNIVVDSVKEYFSSNHFTVSDTDIEKMTIFIDDFIAGGYGLKSQKIDAIISESMVKYGVPLDATYTGKAFAGMIEYISKNNIRNKNILFIHTGGTPLFFDRLDHKKYK